MSCWDKNKTKTQTSRAGGKAGEAVLRDAAGSDIADRPEQRDAQTNPAGGMRHPPPPPPAPSLTCLPAAARHRRRSQQPDGTGMSGCASLPPPVAPFPATEGKLDPSSQAPAPRQRSEVHLS